MKIIEINKKEELDEFLERQKFSQFLQSWTWGEIQKDNSCSVLRLALVSNNGNILAILSAVKKKLFFSYSYYYCPRGPVFATGKENSRLENLKFLFQELKKKAERDRVVFFRFEPNIDLELLDFNFQKSIDLQPAKTWLTDLSLGEDEILSAMHQKTRYNIRLATKKGVEIFEASTSDDFEKFWLVMQATGDRDGFRLHNKEYYKSMVLNGAPMLKLFLAKINEEIIAGGIFSFFGDTATYIHGASSNKYRNFMAPYILQWTIIKKAKEFGNSYYDWHGISEDKWPGVTRFKKGFSGFEHDYVGTYDLIFDKLIFRVYQALRKFRRLFN